MSNTPSSSDEQDLKHFGYAQELFRSMGGFSNFAISFSIISILTGAVTLYGYGLNLGGPLEMSLGWPVATLFTLLLAASMAELCSAYPTSGAMYHWATALGGRAPGWFVASLNIVGLIAALAGINFSAAQFVLPFLGISPSPGHVFLMFAFTLLVHGLINHFGVRLVALLNNTSVVIHIIGVFAIAGVLFWLAPRQPVSFLASTSNSSGHPYTWAFLLGLLQAHWTYTGFDGSAHMAEETHDPRRVAPWGTVIAVAVSGVVGYILLLSITLAIRSVPEVLAAHDAQGNPIPAAIAILQSGLGYRFGNALAAFASVAMWFCGLSCVTSASRAIYSLARDHGTPFAATMQKVSTKHGTPVAAIWATVIAALAAMAWTGAVPIVTSLSTVALYLAYVIPVALGLRARLRGSDWPKLAIWTLGRWGTALNSIALVYTLFICFVLMMPPNQLAAKTLVGVLIVLSLVYILEVRRKFITPGWVAELQRIPGDATTQAVESEAD
ncbi:MAG: amino acid permease [Acidobacteria bacterium]|nr:amino acid permease [Acidobacteriota bacterium]